MMKRGATGSVLRSHRREKKKLNGGKEIEDLRLSSNTQTDVGRKGSPSVEAAEKESLEGVVNKDWKYLHGS